MSPIAPHSPPVVPTPTDQPAPNGGQKGGGKSEFDDFLSDQSSTGTPSPVTPIEDNPADGSAPRDPRKLDPMKPIGGRPIRWKDSKEAAETKTGDPINASVPPSAQTNPILLVPSIAMTPPEHWSPPEPLPEDGGSSSTGADSATSMTATANPISGISAATVTTHTAGIPRIALMSQYALVSSVASGAVAIQNSLSANATTVPVQTLADAMVTPKLPMVPDHSNISGTLDGKTAFSTVPTDDSPGTEAARLASTDAMTANVMPPPNPSLSMVGQPENQLGNSISDTPPKVGSTTGTTDSALRTTGPVILPTITSPILVEGEDKKTALSDALPSPDTSGTGYITSPPVDSDAAPVSTGHITPQPVGSDVPTLPPVTDSRLVVPQAATPWASSTLQAAIVSNSTATALPPSDVSDAAGAAGMSSGAPVETSRPMPREGAKIADPVAHRGESARRSVESSSQVAVKEDIAANNKIGGTTVARDAVVVNNTAATLEKDPEASPLAKRESTESTDVAASVAGTVNSPANHGEVLLGTAITGVANVGTHTAQAAQTGIPEAAGTRQIERVETVLQHALSVGESIRPVGQSQMEMRVRLNGGNEDVTVRLNVADDRLQVTFQTDSPALRQALETGWKEMSANAAQNSTLAMAEPRFETPQANPFVTDSQGHTQSFSFDQQNSRRQDNPTPGDDAAPTPGIRRATVTANKPADASTTGRRLSGWA